MQHVKSNLAVVQQAESSVLHKVTTIPDRMKRSQGPQLRHTALWYTHLCAYIPHLCTTFNAHVLHYAGVTLSCMH